MKRILNIVVLLPVVLLILGNMYITIEAQSTVSILSGNLTAPVPTSTRTDDQKSFAPPGVVATFFALPLVFLGICCTMLLLVGVFILRSIRSNQSSR